MRILMVVTLMVLLLASACGGGSSSGASTAPGARAKTAEDVRDLGCLTPAETAQHEGQFVLVCGTVAESVYMPEMRRTTFVYFDAPPPDHTFTAMITGGSRSGFNPFPEDQFTPGTNACVEGVVVQGEDGKPLIDVQSALSMITLESLEISGEHCAGN